MEKKRYYYKGAVTSFGKIKDNFWKGYTHAVSEAQAVNNLKSKYKETHGLEQNTCIEFPGKVILDE